MSADTANPLPTADMTQTQKRSAYHARYREKNRDAINAKNRAAYKLNPEKSAAYFQKHKARYNEQAKLRRVFCPICNKNLSYQGIKYHLKARHGIEEFPDNFSSYLVRAPPVEYECVKCLPLPTQPSE